MVRTFELFLKFSVLSKHTDRTQFTTNGTLIFCLFVSIYSFRWQVQHQSGCWGKFCGIMMSKSINLCSIPKYFFSQGFLMAGEWSVERKEMFSHKDGPGKAFSLDLCIHSLKSKHGHYVFVPFSGWHLFFSSWIDPCRLNCLRNMREKHAE